MTSDEFVVKLRVLAQKRLVEDGTLLKIGVLMAKDIRQHFDQQRGPDGAWAALQPTYQSWKKSHGYDTRRNIRTGDMMNTIQPVIVSDTQVNVISTVDYWKYANATRAFSYLTDECIAAISTEIVNDTKDSFEKA